MKKLFLAGLWASILACGARAGELCGVVSVAGRPLPEGFVSLSPDSRSWAGSHAGRTRRSMVRVRDGVFCLKEVEPGNYILRIAPSGHAHPMRLSLSGIHSNLEESRLSVTEEATSVHDARGRPLASGPLSLEPLTPDAGTARLEGTLIFPAAVEADLAREPVLVTVKMMSLAPSVPVNTFAYAFAWATGSFTMKVPEGEVESIALASPKWAIASQSPGLRDQWVRMAFSSSTTAKVAFRLGPTGKVSGTVSVPRGGPFRPEDGSSLQVRMLSPREDFALFAHADESGRYEFNQVAAGTYELDYAGKGEKFGFNPSGPASVFWLAAGESLVRDVQLGDWSAIRADPARIPLPLFKREPQAYDRSGESLLYPYEQILGVPSGEGLPSRQTSRLLFPEETPVTLYRDPAGIWIPRGELSTRPSAALESRFSAGVYDFYLVKMMDLTLFHDAVLVLSVAAAVPLKKGELADLAFPAADDAGGGAELRGSFTGMLRLTLEALRSAESLAQLHERLAPRLNLYNAKGRLAGVAFAHVDNDEMQEIVDALAGGDADRIRKFFSRPKRDFRLWGLQPGRYRVEVVAHGFPISSREIDLTKGKPLRWDIDLEAK